MIYFKMPVCFIFNLILYVLVIPFVVLKKVLELVLDGLTAIIDFFVKIERIFLSPVAHEWKNRNTIKTLKKEISELKKQIQNMEQNR